MKNTTIVLKVVAIAIIFVVTIFVSSFKYNILASELNSEAINLLDVGEVTDYNQSNAIKTTSMVENLRGINAFDISLTPNSNGYGSVSIDWSGYDYTSKAFKAYKSSDGGKTYETVGIDYVSVDIIKCLQIYPVASASNQIKTWMETNGYGKGIISMDSVYIDTFNANPNAYLKDTDGNWKYDVIFFGTADANGSKDLSSAASVATEAYIKSGRGCIFGHDTIYYPNHPNFYRLAPYFNITVVSNINYTVQSTVEISQKGLFTNYPWYIGEVGTRLTIPAAHPLSQYAKGTIWLKFVGGSYSGCNNFYLTTYNNCAMIQTGHSNGAATVDEQKILANLIFYCNQLSFSTHTINDSSAQDLANPNAPAISLNGNQFDFSATDNGSTYYYYVESYSDTDTTAAGLLDRSVIKNTTVTTGVKSYKYIYYNTETTKVTTSNGTSTTSSVGINQNYKYLHVATVDGAGNISDTTTIKLSDSYTIKYNGNGATGGNTENSNHIFNVLQNLTANGFEKKYTVTFNHNYENCENIEKEATYTFRNWNTKANGTGISFYDEEQVKNLASNDGEIVDLYAIWNSASISYKPTRLGYKFEGWYSDPECTKRVTKKEYVPQKDITLYAKWEEVEYKTPYTIDYYYNNVKDTSKREMGNIKATDIEVKQKIESNLKEGYTFEKVEDCTNAYNVIKIYYVATNGNNPENPEPVEPEKPIDPVTGERLYTITIDNDRPGHTYNSYQVFQGDYYEKEDEEGNRIPILLNIEWGEELQREIIADNEQEYGKTHGDKIIEALKEQNPKLYKDCQTADDVANVLQGKENDGDVIREFTNICRKIYFR